MNRLALTLLFPAVLFSFTVETRAQLIPGVSVKTTRVDTYAPESPWSNGYLFQNWIGHGGKFYNCDCEEEKRFSPYIHWKTVTHCETPRVGWNILKHDIDEVRARVRTGKCLPACWPRVCCPDCQIDDGCRTCQTAAEHRPDNFRNESGVPAPTAEQDLPDPKTEQGAVVRIADGIRTANADSNAATSARPASASGSNGLLTRRPLKR